MKTEVFDGFDCKGIIQHEYDHIEGVYLDKITFFKKFSLG